MSRRGQRGGPISFHEAQANQAKLWQAHSCRAADPSQQHCLTANLGGAGAGSLVSLPCPPFVFCQERQPTGTGVMRAMGMWSWAYSSSHKLLLNADCNSDRGKGGRYCDPRFGAKRKLFTKHSADNMISSPFLVGF